MCVTRLEEEIIRYHFNNIPVVAIIGARQVGKTTLAKSLIKNYKNTVILDLEKSSDRQIIKNTEKERYGFSVSKILELFDEKE